MINLKIQRLKVNKLFFNKWPYKVECYLTGASRVKHTGVDRTIEWCKNSNEIQPFIHDPQILAAYHKLVGKIDKKELLKFAQTVKPFMSMKGIIQIRAEGNHFNLFCADKEVLSDMSEKLKPWIKNIWGPTTEEEHKFFADNDYKKILCDQYPKELYRYRIFLREKMKSDQRLNFLSWSEKYSQDQILISPITKEWLAGIRLWKQDPFLYVKDSSFLSMVLMFLGNNARKVDEFVLRDSITL